MSKFVESLHAEMVSFKVEKTCFFVFPKSHWYFCGRPKVCLVSERSGWLWCFSFNG